MRYHPLTPDHVCETSSMFTCWHVRATFPDGRVLDAWVMEDSSVGARVSVTTPHPDATVTRVVFGTRDTEHGRA